MSEKKNDKNKVPSPQQAATKAVTQVTKLDTSEMSRPQAEKAIGLFESMKKALTGKGS